MVDTNELHINIFQSDHHFCLPLVHFTIKRFAIRRSGTTIITSPGGWSARVCMPAADSTGHTERSSRVQAVPSPLVRRTRLRTAQGNTCAVPAHTETHRSTTGADQRTLCTGTTQLPKIYHAAIYHPVGLIVGAMAITIKAETRNNSENKRLFIIAILFRNRVARAMIFEIIFPFYLRCRLAIEQSKASSRLSR